MPRWEIPKDAIIVSKEKNDGSGYDAFIEKEDDGSYCLMALNEGGFCCTCVDLEHLLKIIAEHLPDLLNDIAGRP